MGQAVEEVANELVVGEQPDFLGAQVASRDAPQDPQGMDVGNPELALLEYEVVSRLGVICPGGRELVCEPQAGLSPGFVHRKVLALDVQRVSLGLSPDAPGGLAAPLPGDRLCLFEKL